ncbi:hypothetical protein [Mesobacillus maritimus]|nr:hypothetical protein [Mesobacillus maritimus]
MKKYIFLAILLFIISGCGISTYQDVTIEDAKEMIANGEVEV